MLHEIWHEHFFKLEEYLCSKARCNVWIFKHMKFDLVIFSVSSHSNTGIAGWNPAQGMSCEMV